MSPSIIAVLVLISIGSSLGQGPGAVEPGVIKIASWNIQILGPSKLKKTGVMKTVKEIIHKYDIVQIQEFRCTKQKTCQDRWNKLKGILDSDFELCNKKFTPKGRSRHKELYLFVYRRSKAVCHGTVELEELDKSKGKKFARPPTAALFQALDTRGQKCGEPFFILGIHTQPASHKIRITIAEINALTGAYNKVMKHLQKTGVKGGLIMGDFNYGGNYVKDGCGANIDSDKDFEGLIGPKERTTVITHNPYDRIYLSTTLHDENLETCGGGGYIDKDPKIIKTVSDHYPVYLCLKFPKCAEPPKKKHKTEKKAKYAQEARARPIAMG